MMPTVLVAIEQSFAQDARIVDDSLACRMLPPGARMLVRLLGLPWLRDRLIAMNERTHPGIWGGLLCRKRYIDETLADASREMQAVVNLGAGLDTRAYRLETLSNLPVWELDQRESIASKEKRLREMPGGVPASVRLVPIDFDHANAAEVLASHGFHLAMKTAFIWEGVSQYLTEDGVRATFELLARASSDSRLLFTYVRKSFIDGETLHGLKRDHERFVRGKVWLSGMEPETVPGLLRQHGWSLTEDLGLDALATRYIAPCRRNLAATPVERVVYARKL